MSQMTPEKLELLHMWEMTPETFRAALLTYAGRILHDGALVELLDLHLSAWETDRKRIEGLEKREKLLALECANYQALWVMAMELLPRSERHQYDRHAATYSKKRAAEEKKLAAEETP